MARIIRLLALCCSIVYDLRSARDILAAALTHILMQPFTKFAVELQSGKFDKPDRLFDSIPQVRCDHRQCVCEHASVRADVG